MDNYLVYTIIKLFFIKYLIYIIYYNLNINYIPFQYNIHQLIYLHLIIKYYYKPLFIIIKLNVLTFKYLYIYNSFYVNLIYL